MESSYSKWFKENYKDLYTKYGECWLIINEITFEIIGIHPKEEVNASLKQYYDGLTEGKPYTHQYCFEEYIQATSFCYSPLISKNNIDEVRFDFIYPPTTK